MKFEIGEENNPKGKAIVYWKINCEKAKEKISNCPHGPIQYLGYEFIVSLNNHIGGRPWVFHSLEDLTELAENMNADVINIGEAECTEDIYAQRNRIAEKYLRLCIRAKQEMKEDVEKESKIESISKEMSESEKLQHLEIMRRYGEASLQEKEQILRKIKELDLNYEKYDIHNMIKAAEIRGEKGKKIVELYLQKYFSVCNEKYEDAAKAKEEIGKWEKEINTKES